MEHLREQSRAAGVTAVRAIQTRTYYGFDNRYLCDSASAHPDWVCGVVTLDPDNPESPAILRRQVRESGVKSLRTSRVRRTGRSTMPGCAPSGGWQPRKGSPSTSS